MNSEYKGCQYFFEGKCRCMDYSFNQDFYECPQCIDVPYCYYKQLKKYEQETKELKEDIKNSPLCYMCKEEDCLKKQLKRCEQKLEKIKEKCKFFISKCKECENPDTTIDCIECTAGGKAVASYKILNIIEDIKEAKDEND